MRTKTTGISRILAYRKPVACYTSREPVYPLIPDNNLQMNWARPIADGTRLVGSFEEMSVFRIALEENRIEDMEDICSTHRVRRTL